MSVSGQLPTYPSPNLTLTCYQLTVVGLGEGQAGSCPDTDIDLSFPKVDVWSINPLSLNHSDEALMLQTSAKETLHDNQFTQ